MTLPVPVIQGEFRLSADPGVTFSTLLGSCVSACFWDETARIGGINHFLLAEGRRASTETVDIRYGVHAMEVLINALLQAGARRSGLRAKLFGGAKMSGGSIDIGRRNADFARLYLATEGIACPAESLGGQQARRVLFHPVTGRARQLLLPQATVPIPETLPQAQGQIQLF